MTLHVNKWCVDLLNIIFIELELHSSDIGDHSWILSILFRTFVFLLSKTFRLFGFPIFWL
jgi:hypothetical protein